LGTLYHRLVIKLYEAETQNEKTNELVKHQSDVKISLTCFR